MIPVTAGVLGLVCHVSKGSGNATLLRPGCYTTCSVCDAALIYILARYLRQKNAKHGVKADLPRRVRTTDLTSPECPSRTFWQLPFTMSHTTASSSPEAVRALVPQLAMAPSVSHPPCPAWTRIVSYPVVNHSDCAYL